MTALGLAALTASAMFIALAIFARQIPGVRYWAAGALAVGFATVLDGPRLIADWRLASLMFNIPFTTGQAFILAGTMQFCNRPHAHRVLRVFAVLAVVLTVMFTYITPDDKWRIWSLCCCQGAANLATAYLLFRYPDPFSRPVFIASSIVALLQALAALAQGVLVSLSAVSITYASPQLPVANMISWGGAMLNIIAGNWLMFLLIMLRLVADLRVVAERDVLTGLLNRRGLRPHIDAILRRGEAHGGAIGIMILDIDHFKQINDTHGHEVGDKVLTVMGEVLLKMGFPSATPCRWGGEEFCIVVEGQSRDYMVQMAEHIRKSFQQGTAELGVLGSGRTVSVGIGRSFIDAQFDVSSLISVADAQLYLAKLAGRDRVAVAE
ncbi:diguanylate cyclase [Massilia sp. CF038]|uniref:GGDEF domain-containing protein n=1 Tax=Massilia sp. CF038 TaxID=1881045 RepID=UPI00093519FE|nr:GGDEF domain-containing protein [Massilia sp. CF038]